jgi:hypothetical protein
MSKAQSRTVFPVFSFSEFFSLTAVAAAKDLALPEGLLREVSMARQGKKRTALRDPKPGVWVVSALYSRGKL